VATAALPEVVPEPTQAMTAPQDDVQWAFWDNEPPPAGASPARDADEAIPPAPMPATLELVPEQDEPEQPEPEPEENAATSRVPEAEPPPMPPDFDAEALARLENADTALMATPLPPAAGLAASSGVPAGAGAPGPSSAPAAELSQDSLIMAVVCQYGHASPQNASHCRICGSPIAPQRPQLIPRPVLAVLRASDGTTAVVDRAVLIGRAPASQLSSAQSPRLMTVPSPGHDISRTHLEVAPDGWQIVVRDLNSTNGTVLVRPGGVDRQQLTAGEPVLVQLGSVVELGDGISVLIDYPQ
jgi:hypothetical protein